eukprot:798564_1
MAISSSTATDGAHAISNVFGLWDTFAQKFVTMGGDHHAYASAPDLSSPSAQWRFHAIPHNSSQYRRIARNREWDEGRVYFKLQNAVSESDDMYLRFDQDTKAIDVKGKTGCWTDLVAHIDYHLDGTINVIQIESAESSRPHRERFVGTNPRQWRMGALVTVGRSEANYYGKFMIRRPNATASVSFEDLFKVSRDVYESEKEEQELECGWCIHQMHPGGYYWEPTPCVGDIVTDCYKASGVSPGKDYIFAKNCRKPAYQKKPGVWWQTDSGKDIKYNCAVSTGSGYNNMRVGNGYGG